MFFPSVNMWLDWASKPGGNSERGGQKEMGKVKAHSEKTKRITNSMSKTKRMGKVSRGYKLPV